MDELSPQEQRDAAFAANLRRVYEVPDGTLPQDFAILLDRLSEVKPSRPEPRRRGTHRLGA